MLRLLAQARVVAPARRHAVDSAAALGGDGEAQETVRTLVSELVTNVVLHAGTDALLAVEDAGECVRVTVTDGSPAPLQRRRLGPASTTGRGSRLLQALSCESGVRGSDAVAPGGKAVWFTVRKTTRDAERTATDAAALDLFDIDPQGVW